MRIKYLKMISYITFIFLTANFVLGMNYTNCLNGYAFLWMLLISAMIYAEVNYNSILTILIDVMLFAPVLFVNGVVCKVAKILIGILVISLQNKVKAEINYDQALYQVKIMFSTSIAFILISFMATDSRNVNEYIVPYAILYIIFAITLLRTMRNYKYNVVNKKIRKINTVYLFIIMAFSALISLKQVRAVIATVIETIYKGIAFILFKAATFLSYYLFKLLNCMHISQDTENKFLKLFRKVYGNPDDQQQGNTIHPAESQSFWAQHGVSIIINIIIVAVIIYIVYKLLKAQYNKKKVNDDFVETRESIRNIGDSKTKRNIYDALKKGSNKDKIRYYYYRFLKDCDKRNINLKSSDTTEEINNKAESVFDKNSLLGMRNIYLKAKYTECECTEEDFEGFHKSYKEK